MILLDTNILARHAVPDDPHKAVQCAKLLENIASGRQQAVVTFLAIAELVWVLLGFYHLPKQQVIETVRKILNTEKLEVTHRETLVRTLELFDSHEIDFIDAYHAAFMEEHRIHTIASYDTDFDQVAGITRKEP